jgi:hypothetical protein
MDPQRIGFFTLLTIAVFSNAGLVSHSAAQQGPCAQIVEACRQAGFVKDGGSAGIGLQVDCIRPIMLGTPQRKKAAKPLPQVDPQIVAACKARNPNFGVGKPRPPGSSEQPPPASPSEKK